MSDPITLLGSVIGGTLFGNLFGKQKAPKDAPPPAAPESAPTGTPNSNKPKAQSSFVSAAAAPPQQTRGTSTLLGQ